MERHIVMTQYTKKVPEYLVPTTRHDSPAPYYERQVGYVYMKYLVSESRQLAPYTKYKAGNPSSCLV